MCERDMKIYLPNEKPIENTKKARKELFEYDLSTYASAQVVLFFNPL